MATITDPIQEVELLPVLHDDRTGGPLALPLPHMDNSAKRDAQRIRASFILLATALSDAIGEADVRQIVGEAVAALVDSSPAALDTLNELAAAIGDDPNFAATIAGQIGSKASTESPTLTGTPRSVTPATTVSGTEIATAAYVRNLLTNGASQGAAWSVPTQVVDDSDTSPASTAFVLAQAATGALLRALTSNTRFVTPKAMADAMAFGTTTTSGTFSPSFTTFNIALTLNGNLTIGQPVNMVDGLPVVLYLIQDGTGSRTISFNSTYNKFPGGNVPTLSTAANAVDRLAGICRSRFGTLVVEWSGIEQDIK